MIQSLLQSHSHTVLYITPVSDEAVNNETARLSCSLKAQSS